MHNKNDLRKITKNNILRHQKQSKWYYDKRRKTPKIYQIGNLVAIQHTQFGPDPKLKIKYFGPYKLNLLKVTTDMSWKTLDTMKVQT